MAEGSQDIILSIGGDTRQLERDIQKVVSSSNLNLNTKGFSQPLGKITGQLGEFEKSLAASNARVIAFGVSAGAIYAVEKAFSGMIKTTIDVQRSLAEINTILSVSQKELSKFGNDLFDLAKNTGQSFDTVAKSALEFSRQGLGVSETLKRTSDALILTRLSGLDVISSTESITSALNSFNQTVISSNELINKLIAVDTGFAVSSADLAEAIKRVGSSAQDAGVSLDELVALVTSAQQITSRGGSVIGNSFKTIFTRLQRPEVLSALDELGVKTKNAEGNIMPLMQILGQLSTKFETLTGTQKSQIAELVGGVFQINILKASLSDLSKEYSVFNQALETSMGATDEANRRNEQLNQTLSSTLNQTLVNLTKSATDIGNISLGPVIQKTLSGLNAALENFSTKKGENDGVGAKIGEGIARGIGNFLGGPGIALALIALTKVFDRLRTYSVDAFKSLSGVNNASMQQSQIQSQVLNIIGKNPQLIDQINKGNIDTASLHRQILSLIEQETANMQKQIGIASSLAKTLSSAGVGVAQSGALKGLVVSNRIKAAGYIPNFNKEDQMEEIGAALGGYKAGSIKRTYLQNEGMVTYNSSESLVKYPGAKDPAILPPKYSQAGKIYKNNFIKQHGFDPYKSLSFHPNFASPVSYKGLANILRADAGRGDSPILKDKLYFGAPGSNLAAKWPNGVPQSMVNAKQDTSSFKSKRIAIDSDAQLLTLSDVRGGIGGYTFKEEPSVGLPGIDVIFPIFGYRNVDKKQKLEENVKNNIKKEVKTFTKQLNVNPPLEPEEIEAAIGKTEGIYGAIGAQVGGIFEAGFRAAFGREVATDLNKGTFDVGSVPEGLKKFFPGAKAGASADFKSSASSENRMDMAIKILKSKNREDLVRQIQQAKLSRSEQYSTKRGKAFGYIPNFSAINQAMEREKKASGRNPEILWSDTLGTPVVVNDEQTSKYGKNADKIIKNDHINQGQLSSISNLMLTGSGKEKYNNRIPNFAKASVTGGPGIENYDDILSSGIGGRASSELEKLIAKLINSNKTTEQIDATLKEVSDKLKMTRDNTAKLNKNLEKTATSTEIPPILPKDLGFSGNIKNTLRKAFDDNALSENVQNFKNKLIFASFGLSMLGGFASTLAGSDKKTAQAIDSFTQSLGTAATTMGYLPGPAGIAVGALIGAAGAINSLTGFLFDKGPAIEASLEKIKDENSNFSNGTQKYSTVLQRLTEAYSNPKAKSSDLVKLNKELIEAAREIPSAYRLQLLAIQDNTKLQEEITKVQKELIQKQKGLEFAAKTQASIDSNTIEKFGRFSTEISKGFFGGNENIIQKIGSSVPGSIPLPGLNSLNSKFLGNILSGLNINSIIEDLFQKMRGATIIKNNAQGEAAASGVVGSFSKEGLNKFEEAFKNPNIANSLRALSSGDFINKMQRDFGLDKNVAESLRNSSPEDIKRLREQIIKLGADAASTSEVLKKTEKDREELSKKIAMEQKVIDQAKSSVDRFKESLEAIAKSSIEFRSYQQKYNQQSDNNKNLLNIEKARGMIDYQKPFLNPFEEAKTNSALEELVRRQEFISDAQSIQSNTNSNLMRTAMEALNSMKGKTEDEKIKDVLSNLSKINTNNSGQNLAQDIKNTLEGLGESFTKGDKEKLNTDLTTELDKQSQQLIDLNQKAIQANDIARNQLAVQKALASRDVDRSAFGGQSAFGMRDLMSDRESLLSKVQAQSNTPGFTTGFIKMITDELGGFKPGEENQAKSIREMLIKSRAQDILYQGNTLKQALSLNTQNYDMYGRPNGSRSYSGGEKTLIDLINKRMSNAGSIASTQVDEAIKTGKASATMPLNIQSMAGDVKTITGLLQKISSNMDGTIFSGIQQAIKDSISNYMRGLNPANGIDSARNKLKEAESNADMTESIGKKKIEILGIQSSKNLNEAMLNQESQRTQGLKENMENANKSLGKWVEGQVNKAISENKPIPSLQELQTQEQKKGSSISRELRDLNKDTGSTDYQAFNSYIENIQKIQQLQEQINTSIESLNQKQQEIQQEITNQLGKKGLELNAENKKPENLTPSGNIMNRTRTPGGQEIISYTGAPANVQNANTQNKNDFDRLGSILQRIIQSTSPQLQNNSTSESKNLSQEISELSSALKTSLNSQPENLNLDGNINVSPLDVQGNVQVSLNSQTFTVQIDDSDLQKTKAQIEKNFDQKLKEMSSKILAEVQKGVAESLRQSIGRASGREMPATTDRPFRNYGVGRTFLG
jgi:TP901 family phage tail tape measure protein